MEHSDFTIPNSLSKNTFKNCNAAQDLKKQLLDAELKKQLHLLAKIFQEKGYSNKAMTEDFPETLKKLSTSRVQEILNRVKRQIAEASSREKRISQFLWKQLLNNHWVPCHDLFDFIQSDKDVVEIYRPNFTQYLSNGNFVKLTNFEWSTLLHQPYYELYHKDEAVMQRHLELGQQIAQGKIKHTIDLRETAPTLVTENRSPIAIQGLVQYKCLSPLYTKDRQLAGAVSIYSILDTAEIETRAPLTSKSYITKQGE